MAKYKVQTPPQVLTNPSGNVIFNGGLDLVDKEYKLPDSKTNKVKNMWFNNGELGIRWGQDEHCYTPYPFLETYEKFYKGKIIAHFGGMLIEIDPNE